MLTMALFLFFGLPSLLVGAFLAIAASRLRVSLWWPALGFAPLLGLWIAYLVVHTRDCSQLRCGENAQLLGAIAGAAHALAWIVGVGLVAIARKAIGPHGRR